MSEILWMSPVFKEMIWGGDKLHTEFCYDIPNDRIGECWAISAHPNGDCRIARGTYAGKTLSSMWKEHPELFGHCGGDRFPLLTKIIDAKDDLSIQVHPDDTYAAVHENGSLGKTECWYILNCEPDTKIVIGHHAKNHQEMKEMIEGKRWAEFIREVPVHKGDFFQIEPGCLHAIKGGTLILETQQNSDITYRVYDYDRLSDGSLRLLHIRQSIDTITAPFEESKPESEVREREGAVQTRFIRCPYYTVDQYEVMGHFQVEFDAPFTNVSIIGGEGTVDGIPCKKGDHMIIPGDYGPCVWDGRLTMICAGPVSYNSYK